MARTFSEEFRKGGGIALRLDVEEILYEGRSEYQEILVFRSPGVGRVLVLDGAIMLTEKDEFVYHEMLAHLPSFAHRRPASVLVVGGGDGGIVRELVKHPEIERIDWVEIDPQVIEVSQRHLGPDFGRSRDPRVRLHHADGARFVEEAPRRYELVLVDSTDPVGPGEVLFGEAFYRTCRGALTEGGVLAAQIGSPIWQREGVRKAFGRACTVFDGARIYMATIPTYPGAHWCFLAARAGEAGDLAEPSGRAPIPGLRYYNADVHRAAFALPEYVAEIARAVEARAG